MSFCNAVLLADSDFLYRTYLDQHKVAVVCSARSGTVKALGTTNLLLKAASEARRPKSSNGGGTATPNGIYGRSSETSPSTPRIRSSPSSRPSSPLTMSPLSPLIAPHTGQDQPAFNVTVDLIRSEHISAAKASVKNPEILQDLEAEIDRDCDWLRSFLFAAQVHSFY